MYLINCVFYLSTIRPDVLYRCSSDLAGNVGEVFQTVKVFRYGVIYKIFPDLTAIAANHHCVIGFLECFNAFQIRINHKTVKKFGREEDVAAATEDQVMGLFKFRIFNQFVDVVY